MENNINLLNKDFENIEQQCENKINDLEEELNEEVPRLKTENEKLIKEREDLFIKFDQEKNNIEVFYNY